MAETETCSCGCAALTTVSEQAACDCSCTCCAPGSTREDEIADLRRLLGSVSDRLAKLDAS